MFGRPAPLARRDHVTGLISPDARISQAAEFGVICVYFLSAFYLDLRALGGPSEIAIKYVGSNIFWFIMPLVVFVWCARILIARAAAAGR